MSNSPIKYQLTNSSKYLICFALLLAAVAGCRSIPGPPYERAFAMDGRTPRLLITSREITVPLTVANTGTRAWDPARVHVSYHWLWLVPRELARRSRWTMPYHEGIRTDLTGTVTPGARIAVKGRLTAPSIPGLYWLQWDMVEEGVTWFNQVSPRPPRQLVVVLPSLAGVFAPLPLAIALAGLIGLELIRRGRRPAPVLVALIAAADVFWCAASLFSKPLLLVPEALLEPTGVAYWLMVVAAVLPPLGLMLVLPRRARAWALFACAAFGTLLILADVVYYRFFGDVVSAPALLAARQTGRVIGTVSSLLTPGLLWLVIDVPFALWLMVSLGRLSPAEWLARRAQPLIAAGAVAVLALAGIALSVPRVLAASRLDQMFRDRAVVEQLGPFGYHAYDAWNYLRGTLLRPRATEAQIQEARAWFADRAALRAGGGPSFGAARGKNLIVVQVESLQDFVVDYRIAAQDVMPSLRRWADDSLRFTNVTDQSSEGRTSDAEFAALVSLLPLDHGAVAFRYASNHYVGFPRVLDQHGYTTVSAVPFEPGFWNRLVMHPAYGFERSLFEQDFELTEQIGWGLNDRDFLRQMVPRLEKLPRPFCAWLITLSLHHPFEDFPDRHKELKLGELEGTSFGNYLHTMRFFDRALEDFKTALAQNGMLDDALLVVFGDHDAGFPQDPVHMAMIGIGQDGVDWPLHDRVPLFVRVPAAASEALRGVRREVAGQVDFAPTLLALLGIDPAPLPYTGRNLLGAAVDLPVLRPYGDWIDAHRFFLAQNGNRAFTCYDLTRRRWVDVNACGDADARARKAREISRRVVTEDLQHRLQTSAPPAGAPSRDQ